MASKRWLSAKDAMSSRMTSCRATSSDGKRCFVKPALGNQRPRPYLGHNCPELFIFCKMPPSRLEPVFRCTQAKPRGERRENPEEAPVLKSATYIISPSPAVRPSYQCIFAHLHR